MCLFHIEEGGMVGGAFRKENFIIFSFFLLQTKKPMDNSCRIVGGNDNLKKTTQIKAQKSEK